MRLHKHRYYVVLREGVLFVSFLASVFVLLLVLGLELLGAAAVVTRKPSEIRVEIPHIAKQITNCLLVHIWKFLGLLIFAEFEDCNDGHVVEVKDTVDLDPLQSYEMVVTGVRGNQLSPYVLRYEIILILL